MGAYHLLAYAYLCHVEKAQTSEQKPISWAQPQLHPKAVVEPLVASPGGTSLFQMPPFWGCPSLMGRDNDRGDPPTSQAQGGRIQSWSQCRQQGPQ